MSALGANFWNISHQLTWGLVIWRFSFGSHGPAPYWPYFAWQLSWAGLLAEALGWSINTAVAAIRLDVATRSVPLKTFGIMANKINGTWWTIRSSPSASFACLTRVGMQVTKACDFTHAIKYPCLIYRQLELSSRVAISFAIEFNWSLALKCWLPGVLRASFLSLYIVFGLLCSDGLWIKSMFSAYWVLEFVL